MNSIFKTNNNNHYLFNSKRNKVMFLHPLVYYFFEKDGQGCNLNELLDNLEDSLLEIEGVGTFTKSEIEYYYRKYIFYKESEHFKGNPGHPQFQRRLKKDDIEKLLTGCQEIIFEVTKTCNMDCHYCIQGKLYEFHDKKQKEHIDLKNAKLMLDYLEKYWSRPFAPGRIGIKFYGGEPLLNMKVVRQIVAYSKTLTTIKDKFYYYITTNGVLLDRYLDYLISNQFYISISLDGNDYNNSYRVFKNGKPAFEKVIANINIIRSNSPSYFETNVTFQSALHVRNSITELEEYFKNTFRKQTVILELTRAGIKKDRQTEFDKMFTSVYQNLYYGKDYPLLKKKKLSELPKTPDIGSGGVIVHKLYSRLLKGGDDAAEKSTPTGTCHPFSKRIFISTDGKILPCERIGHKYALGQIKDKVILDFQAIADMYNHYYDNMMGLCGACSNLNICKKCMFYCSPEKSKTECDHYSGQSDSLKRLAEDICYMEDCPAIYYKHLTEV